MGGGTDLFVGIEGVVPEVFELRKGVWANVVRAAEVGGLADVCVAGGVGWGCGCGVETCIRQERGEDEAHFVRDWVVCAEEWVSKR